MPCQFNMIFSGIFEDFSAKITVGRAATWSRGWRARPTPLGACPCLVGTSCALRTPFSCRIHLPTEIEAFKMIEIVRVQNNYLNRENVLLQEHIIALKCIIHKLEDLLRSMCNYPSSPTPSSPTRKNWASGMGTPLGNCQAWGRCPGIISPSHSYLFRFI